MDETLYAVEVEFAAKVEPGKAMGRNVSKLEAFLPAGAAVRLVRVNPGADLVEVEVRVASASPAMALRDVARAIELVASPSANESAAAAESLGDVCRATITRVGDDAVDTAGQ